MENNLKERLTKLAVFFYQTHGLPLELFNAVISKMNKQEQLFMCYYFEKRRRA